MKRLLFAIVGITIFISMSSCRITKSVTMMIAKNRATMKEADYLTGKHLAVDFLKFTPEQITQVENVWRTEKKAFSEVKLVNENIGPIIYKAEIDFRAALTADQLELYKRTANNEDTRILKYFLNDNSLDEIKRIYIDK